MTFPEWLESVGACVEARRWVASLPDQSPEYVWEHCERVDWLLWWHEKVGTRFTVLAPVVYAAVNRALVHAGVEVAPVVDEETARTAAGEAWGAAGEAWGAAGEAAEAAGEAARGASAAAAWGAAAGAAEHRLCAEECRRMLAMPDMSAILNP
jgi:hypothetical protein